MIHILNRKNKNNPVIIGESGVGKTAVVEGLAQAIDKLAMNHSLAVSMGRTGFNHVQRNHSMDKFVDDLTSIYKKVIMGKTVFES